MCRLVLHKDIVKETYLKNIGPREYSEISETIPQKECANKSLKHLKSLRHEQIAFISGPLGLISAKAHRNAFEQAMSEIGLEILKGGIVETNKRSHP